MQEAIAERIDVLKSKTTYDARYLIVMGGILMNGDHDMGSVTELRRVDAIDLKTKQRHDLLPEVLAACRVDQ